MHVGSEDLLRDPKQKVPNNRLIMNLDPELVEQGGTQETPPGSLTDILKAGSLQIYHHQHFADHTSTSRHRESRAQGALYQPEPATVLYRAEAYQVSSVWSSSSSSLLPTPDIEELSNFALHNITTPFAARSLKRSSSFPALALLNWSSQCAIPGFSSIPSAGVGQSRFLSHARKAAIFRIVPLSRMA